MEIAHECIGTNTVTIRPSDKIRVTFEIRSELRVRDCLRKGSFKTNPYLMNVSSFDNIEKCNILYDYVDIYQDEHTELPDFYD
jgi:uncharacterized Fe-S radical SAM superfamily protein PflX